MIGFKEAELQGALDGQPKSGVKTTVISVTVCYMIMIILVIVSMSGMYLLIFLTFILW